MSTYILLTPKSWHDKLFDDIQATIKGEWIRITEKDEFTKEFLDIHKPDFIFIPHWSNIIPKDIYNSFNCVVFHMTDLPFGRGGSPLQNLISRGYKTTKITAIKVEQGLDTGDMYIKKTLGLEGTATEIFERSSSVIKEMICEIISQNIQPLPQFGEVTEFKRRKLEDSNINELHDLEKVYDHIRMLDCDGYPHAFVETANFKFEFINANFDENEEIIIANVRISKK